MEIVWRAAALNDLEAIREFIAEDNPAAAIRIVEAIRKPSHGSRIIRSWAASVGFREPAS